MSFLLTPFFLGQNRLRKTGVTFKVELKISLPREACRAENHLAPRCHLALIRGISLGRILSFPLETKGQVARFWGAARRGAGLPIGARLTWPLAVSGAARTHFAPWRIWL